jgi:serine/threonine-protein kinase RIO1
MIDVKQAVQIAKAKAAEMLETESSNLEEIEQEFYKVVKLGALLSASRETQANYRYWLALQQIRCNISDFSLMPRRANFSQ